MVFSSSGVFEYWLGWGCSFMHLGTFFFFLKLIPFLFVFFIMGVILITFILHLGCLHVDPANDACDIYFYIWKHCHKVFTFHLFNLIWQFYFFIVCIGCIYSWLKDLLNLVWTWKIVSFLLVRHYIVERPW